MSPDQVLLVEGTDDQHVIWALLKAHGIPEVFSVEQKGGIDRLLHILPVQLKGSATSAVGVVIDADVDLAARWKTVCAIVNRSGYHTVPAAPDENGTIIVARGLPRFGVWLMPDNSLTGMLEDFVKRLVPVDDVGFSHAHSVLTSLPAAVQRFGKGHFAKAHIHTWLAWQADPGTPMGLALTKKYLDAHAPSAVTFLQWAKKLFV